MNVTGSDLLTLLVISLPVAAIAWAVTHEELFREFHDHCVERSQRQKSLLARKFFYLFTCEYCFSHWVTIAVLVVTRYKLMYADWKGYVVAGFSLVFVANSYLNLYSRLRVDITSEKKEIEVKEKEIEAKDKQIQVMEAEMTGGAPRGNGR